MEEYKIVFESERIYYVELTEKLVDDYLVMVNDPEIQEKISHEKRTYTHEGELSWIKARKEENPWCFSMIEKETGEFIGNIELRDVVNGVSEIGICITGKKQDQHFGTEAMKAIVEYGSNVVGIKGFDLNVYSTNPRAIHCYEKVGFKKEGEGKTAGDIHMSYHK